MWLRMHRIVGNGDMNSGIFRATAASDLAKMVTGIETITSSFVFLESSMMTAYSPHSKLREEYHIIPSNVGTSRALFSVFSAVIADCAIIVFLSAIENHVDIFMGWGTPLILQMISFNAHAIRVRIFTHLPIYVQI